MSPSKHQREQVVEALLDAFDNAELEQMLRHQLDVVLSHVATGPNLRGIVFQLVEWAARAGRIQDVIRGAHAKRPENARVQVLYSQSREWDFSSEVDAKADTREPDLQADLKRYLAGLLGQVESGPIQNIRVNPFKQLAAYDYRDTSSFFGRAKAIVEVLECIDKSRLSILHAQSGAGKTSLLKAGVIPHLLQRGFIPLYLRLYDRSVDNAIKNQFPAMARIQSNSWWTTPLHQFLIHLAQLADTRQIVIVLDQFEELFTIQTLDGRKEFLEQLRPCLDDSFLPVRWVLSLRGEWFSRLSEFRPTIRALYDNEYYLPKLDEDEAREAIVRPAALYGVEYAPKLLRKLLDAMFDEGIEPSQLQLVCWRLFEELDDQESTITNAIYESCGGATGILRTHLNRVLDRMPEQRVIARSVLEELVDHDGHRQLRTAEQLFQKLGPYRIDSLQLESILAQLVDNRLLRIEDRFPVTSGVAYELVSDLLLGEIDQSPLAQARKQAEEIIQRDLEFLRRNPTHVVGESYLRNIIEPVSQSIEPRLTQDEKRLLLYSYLHNRNRNEIDYWIESIGLPDARQMLVQRLMFEPRQLNAEQLAVLLDYFAILATDGDSTISLLTELTLSENDDSSRIARSVLSAVVAQKPTTAVEAVSTLSRSALDIPGNHKDKAVKALGYVDHSLATDALKKVYASSTPDLESCQVFFATITESPALSHRHLLAEIAIHEPVDERRALAQQTLLQIDAAEIAKDLFEASVPTWRDYQAAFSSQIAPYFANIGLNPSSIKVLLQGNLLFNNTSHNRAFALIRKLISAEPASKQDTISSLIYILNDELTDNRRTLTRRFLKLLGFPYVIAVVFLLGFSAIALLAAYADSDILDTPSIAISLQVAFSILWLLLPTLMLFGLFLIIGVHSELAYADWCRSRFPRLLEMLSSPDTSEFIIAQSMIMFAMSLPISIVLMLLDNSLLLMPLPRIILVFAFVLGIPTFVIAGAWIIDVRPPIITSWLHSGPRGERRRNTAKQLASRLQAIHLIEYLYPFVHRAAASSDWNSVDQVFPLNIVVQDRKSNLDWFSYWASADDDVGNMLAQILQHTESPQVFRWISDCLVGSRRDFVEKVLINRSGTSAIGEEAISRLVEFRRQADRNRPISVSGAKLFYASLILAVLLALYFLLPHVLFSGEWELIPYRSVSASAWIVEPASLDSRALHLVNQLIDDPFQGQQTLARATQEKSFNIYSTSLSGNQISQIVVPLSKQLAEIVCDSESSSCLTLHLDGRVSLILGNTINWLTSPPKGLASDVWISRRLGNESDYWLLVDNSLYVSNDRGISWEQVFIDMAFSDLLPLDELRALLVELPLQPNAIPSVTTQSGTIQSADRETRDVRATVNGGKTWQRHTGLLASGWASEERTLNKLLQDFSQSSAAKIADIVPKQPQLIAVDGQLFPDPFPSDVGLLDKFKANNYYLFFDYELSDVIIAEMRDGSINVSNDGAAWRLTFSSGDVFGDAVCGMTFKPLALAHSETGTWLYRTYYAYDGVRGVLLSRDYGRTWEHIPYTEPMPFLKNLYRIYPRCGEFWRSWVQLIPSG